MTVKNILCAYSGETNMGSGLRHAIKIAKHHDGWLTGILRHGRHVIERLHGGALPESVLEILREKDLEHIKEISDQFQAILVEQGIADRSNFVDLDAEEGVDLTEYARMFDLVVTGVHSNAIEESHMSANPDLIALRSGRPVLVVPDGYDAPGLSDHALLAWDGKRSAARALGDAMPILEEKAGVTVLMVGSAPLRGADTLMENLRRHGIDAKLEVRPKSRSIANTILETADQVGAKLLVMGAFEHSKFSHDLMGGVTTDVMRDARVPVFMSH